MIIDKFLLSSLSSLSSRAKASPRLRQNFDLRNSGENNSPWMLNALEPETVHFESKDGAWEPMEEEDIMPLH